MRDEDPEEIGRRNQRIIDRTPSLIAIYDLEERRIRFANRALCSFLGLADGEMQAIGPGRQPDFILPGEFESVKRWIGACSILTDDQRAATEFQMRNAAGEWRFVRVRATVFDRNAGGEVQSLLCVCSDVTELRMVRSRSRSVSQRLEAVFQAAPVAIVCYALEGTVTMWNPAAERVFGYLARDVVGRLSPFLADPEALEQFRGFIQQLRTGTRAQGQSVTRRHKNGAPIEVTLWNAPVVDEDGTVSAAMAMYVDDRVRNEAERELKRSESRLHRSQRIARLGTWESDAETGLGEWSEEVYSLFGLDRSVRPSREVFLSLTHADDRQRVRDALSHSRQTGEPLEIEHRLVLPSGEVRVFRLHAEPIRGTDQKVARTIGVCQDVTEIRKLEEQFRQSQRLESVGHLAGGIAHDFNNLLTVINGYAGILLARLTADNPDRTAVQQIADAGERAAALTRQLLAFTSRQASYPEVLAVDSLFDEFCPLIRPLLGPNHPLRVTAEAGLPGVFADSTQMHQVLMNLVVNARDAMPLGGAIGLAAYSRSGDVIIEVTDTGIGMSKALQERMFEPFFTTKARGKGVGLGLSTTYGIVTQAGGRFEVDSAPGQGTRFRVVLPGSDAAPQAAPAGIAPPPKPRTAKLLVVEDQQEVRRYAVEVLKRDGHEVFEALSGDDAIRVIEDVGHVDLVLTDVVMPGMRGPELAEHLRATRPSLEFVFMSGYTEDLGRPTERAHKFNFLQKPFTPDTLIGKIREVLAT